MTSLQKQLWLVAATTVALFLAVIALGIFLFTVAGENRRIASRTNQALCELRHDLERRTAASRQFLRQHPNGIPLVPAPVIRQQITNQQRTINALSNLDC